MNLLEMVLLLWLIPNASQRFAEIFIIYYLLITNHHHPPMMINDSSFLLFS